MALGTEAVEDRIERLRASFEFPVESETYDLDERGYERAVERREWGVVGVARVWVEREGATLLVREVGRQEGWGCPGGLVEPGESVLEAGRREVREETGVGCEILLVAGANRVTFRAPATSPRSRNSPSPSSPNTSAARSAQRTARSATWRGSDHSPPPRRSVRRRTNWRSDGSDRRAGPAPSSTHTSRSPSRAESR